MANELEQLRRALAERYRVGEEVGRGGMATVHRAHDVKHDRVVALKVLRPELAAALGTGRFLREITLTARLDHPHILPLLDSGEADGLLYYVMPFVDGESLRARLDREKQLPLDDVLRIARQVADALGHAHRQGTGGATASRYGNRTGAKNRLECCLRPYFDPWRQQHVQNRRHQPRQQG